MTRIFAAIALLFTSYICDAQLPGDIRTINMQDTLVFDLSQAVTASGYVEFPVYFLSDDTVNAVDFSLKYNGVDFAYDTIIKLASYLTTNANYDVPSSTLFFTSYSLQRITNDTPLILIRFQILHSGQFCSDDLNTVVGYLNGDLCSVKIVNCVTSGITDAVNTNTPIDIYPNPSAGILHISFNDSKTEVYQLIISDMSGRDVYTENKTSSIGRNEIKMDLEFLTEGIYQLQMISETMRWRGKIVLQ